MVSPGCPACGPLRGFMKMKLSPWGEVEAVMGDLIRAVTAMDEAGFHGPYALGLAPARYNFLFHRYPQGPTTVMEHVRTLITGGVVKIPALKDGGVLLATGR